MGSWNISIKGSGSHHNSAYPLDANRLAARFVDELRAAGHSVESAFIEHSEQRDDLTDPAAYEHQLREGGRFGTPEPEEPIMQFFAWAHLPLPLQGLSRLFGDAAQRLIATLPRNAERSVALRKLLEGKDAAVRARLAK